MVATVQQTQSPKVGAAEKKSGQKTVDKKANLKVANNEKQRSRAASLAGAVGKGLQDTAGAAVNAGRDVAKESIKGGLTSAVINFVGPIRFMVMSNPVGHMAARPLVKFLAPKLEEYLEANNIELGIKPSAILNQVLFGDLEDIDGEVSKALDGFIEKALPENIKEAINSGDIKKIASITATGLTTGTKGFINQLFNFEPGKSKFTSPFKYIGAKTPLLKKLPNTFQPWAAGVGVVMFGGLIVKLMIKATKLLVSGTLIATAAVFGKKMFDRMTKSKPHHDKPQGFMGHAMKAMSGLAGAPSGHPNHGYQGAGGATGKAGVLDMLKGAGDMMGKFSKN